MSTSRIENCVRRAVAEGKIKKETADEYIKELQRVQAKLDAEGRGNINEYLFATSNEAERMLKAARRGKQQLALSILTTDRVWEQAGSHTRGRFFGLLSTFGENIWGQNAPNSIPSRTKAIYGVAQSFMSDSITQFRSQWAGLKASEIVPNGVIDELFSKDTGNALYKAGAKGYSNAVKWLMQSMKDAGVPIHDVGEWFAPQRFDPGAVRAMGLTNFTESMMKRWKDGDLKLSNWSHTPKEELAKELDPRTSGLDEIQNALNEETKVARSTNVTNKAGFDKLLDNPTNKIDELDESILNPGVDDALARQIFHKAFMNISTDGAALKAPGEFMSTTLADKYGQRRAFTWTSADAWKRFNNDMGVGEAGVGDLLIKHLQELSRDLAMAQVLGPRPDISFRLLQQMYRSEGGSKFGAHVLDSTYYHASGMSASPVSEKWAHGMQAARSYLTAAQLPTAIVSAFSDLAFTRATVVWNGLDATRFLSKYLKSMATGDDLARREFVAQGLVLEDGLRGMGDMSRNSVLEVYERSKTAQGTETGLSALNRFAGKSAEFVLRTQGLIRHTQEIRNNLGASFLATHGAYKNLTLEELRNARPDTARFFDTYGISSQEWDMLRATATKAMGTEADFIYAARLAREGDGKQREAAVKYLSAISNETYMASPEANTVMRGLFLGKTNPGTLMGEAARTNMMYKGFPVSVMMMHTLRSVDGLYDLMQGQAGLRRGMYGAALVAAMIPLGAFSVQVANLISGKDPEPMDTPSFWAKAAAKAGVGGILGDWAKSALETGSAKEMASILVPPLPMAAIEGVHYLAKNSMNAVTPGKQSHFAYEGLRLANRYTPDLLWTKQVMDRMVWDSAYKMADPAAAARGFNTVVRRTMQDQGTDFFWSPGEALPDRAPSLR